MPGERGEGAATAAPALRRQLFLILALRCLRTASFAQPVLVVWFAAVGVSPAGVLWLSSAYSALVILAEVPSGVISDGLGRRRTLLWAFVALSGSFGAAALADRAHHRRRVWLIDESQLRVDHVSKAEVNHSLDFGPRDCGSVLMPEAGSIAKRSRR